MVLFDFLPKDIENIIIDYKEQLENTEKYSKIITDIEEQLDITYLVPLWEYDSLYIYKSIKYKDEKFKRFNSIICWCCGRDISLTVDEYLNYNMDEDSINYQLHQLHESINKDIYKKRYEKLEIINTMCYEQTREEIKRKMDGYIIGETTFDNNRYQVILEHDDDIEEILFSDDEVIDLTEEEFMELLQDMEED
jgi:hypothetical protein